MARKGRIEFPGAVYDVLDRGDRREPIGDGRGVSLESRQISSTARRWTGQTFNKMFRPNAEIARTDSFPSWTANALNQYTNINGVIPQYDGNFNLWVWGPFRFNYDPEKRVTSVSKDAVTQVQCTYDGLGRVVRRIEGEERKEGVSARIATVLA